MTWLIGGLIIVAIIVMVVRRGLQMKDLAHKGVVAKGRVVRKFRRTQAQGKHTSGYLEYEFTSALGQRHKRAIAVSEGVYGSHEEGDDIDVVYLPDRPQVNGARYMVNLSREALKLPPL